MHCPYRREVVMVYCDAWPVKKPVRSDQLVPDGPCARGDFKSCPILRDLSARYENAATDVPDPAATHPTQGGPS